MVLGVDFETRATCDLRASGVYRYAEDVNTDIWCMAWAFDDEEPAIWTPADGVLPLRVCDHIHAGREMRAFNAQFERVIWNKIMVPRYGAPPVRLEQWVDTAAEAAAMALPRSLDQCAAVLGVRQQKDQDGYGLMMRMTRPRDMRDDGTPIWWDEAGSRELAAKKQRTERTLEKDLADVRAKRDRLFAYCMQDVRTERAIMPALRRLTPAEREVYLLDQRMNDRGVLIDLPLVSAARGIVSEAVDRAELALEQVTGGAVTSITKPKQLLAWVQSQGVDATSMAKPAVAELLSSDLDPKVREALQLRVDAGRSSVAKLVSMEDVACVDGRARGLLLYHGAGTGRWSGKLLQPQNFPRGEVGDIEAYIPDVLEGRYDAIDLYYPPIVVVSSMLRGMLRAPDGYDLIAGDYSAIEARVLNWLAGQQDIVDLFARGEDVYKYNAARLYNIPLGEVKKFPHRQTGKFQELGCGYGMGWKKAVSAAKDVYGLEISPEQAREIVDSYRATHPRVKAFWYETENACLDAIAAPGQPFTFGAARNLKAIKAGAYLYLVLPSGRPLCFAAPKIVEAPTPWGEMKNTMEFSGVDSYTRQWGRMRAYGGLLVENIVQAVSRDLLAEAMLRLENDGYTPVLSCHDEIICEVPQDFGSVKEFEERMCVLPNWAAGCPVAAEAWRGERYRK